MSYLRALEKAIYEENYRLADNCRMMRNIISEQAKRIDDLVQQRQSLKFNMKLLYWRLGN